MKFKFKITNDTTIEDAENKIAHVVLWKDFITL